MIKNPPRQVVIGGRFVLRILMLFRHFFSSLVIVVLCLPIVSRFRGHRRSFSINPRFSFEFSTIIANPSNAIVEAGLSYDLLIYKHEYNSV